MSREPATDPLVRATALAEPHEPALPIERYAAIAAELGLIASVEGRAEALARHGFDEDRWLCEERAWLERMAEQALTGDMRTAAAFGTAFAAAEDARCPAAELDAMVHEYAAVRARLARGDELPVALRAWGLSVAQWIRLERHFARKIAGDPAFAAEIDRPGEGP